MEEGETVNSRIDPTGVGQIKPLQPHILPLLRETVGICDQDAGGDESLSKLCVSGLTVAAFPLRLLDQKSRGG